MRIKRGDEVLLISPSNHTYFVKAENEVLHVSDGKLELKNLINSEFGTPLKTHLGVEYGVLSPSFLDLHKTLKRGPQVILPKDAAAIVAHTGISSGSNLVDSGTGSGWLTSFLAHVIAPGKITSYEIREDFYQLSKDNVKRLGLKNVKLKNKDITKGIEEKNLDLITLDLLTPTKVPGIKQALKVGGYCVAYVPHMNQAEEFATFALSEGLHFEKVIEVRENNFIFKDSRLRRIKKFPHTGFLVLTRKIKN